MIYCISDTGWAHRHDARIELDGGNVLLHSRGGPTGGRPPRNTDYEKALISIIRRLRPQGTATSTVIQRILLDSKIARRLPENERILATSADIKGLSNDELVRFVRRRAREWGQEPTAKGGNSTKALRIETMERSKSSIRSTLNLMEWKDQDNQPANDGPGASRPSAVQVEEALKDLPPDDGDRTAVEGDLKVAIHMRRERASGLAKKKKAAFIDEHGRLFCERCNLDPSEVYGSTVGNACIEVHHALVQIKDMKAGHETKLEDLQCLCANCHRVTHREMAS